FRQHLDAHGRQTDEPEAWRPEAHRALGALGDALEEMPERAAIEVGGRAVHLRAWRYLVRGVRGVHAPPAPVFLLDTAIEENHPDDRGITDVLYGGDARDRLRQEVVLGLGGVAMLRALGYRNVAAYHMNEGHSALLVLALLREQAGSVGRGVASEEARAAVRARCVFTTHTAVPAGHDHFALDLARDVLGEEAVDALAAAGGCVDGTLSMTHLALNASRYVNGVTARHGEVSRALFPGYAIASITNGVHAGTWTSPPFQALFDRRLPDWRRDNLTLRSAIEIPTVEVREAHEEAKRALLVEVERRTGRALAPGAMTLGFARRATAYKRTDLLFADLDRLRALASTHGPLQVVVGGKAHPQDAPGQAMIRRVFDATAALEGALPVVYLEDYGMALGQVVCAGVDLWLNTPQRPHEASGTSGMKAALNGVPSLSTLDGWW
ncbi:MAG: alpha-glucan family phosphorylase, partial [Dehalococcoidia bacterium]